MERKQRILLYEELREYIEDWSKRKGLTRTDLLPFLSATLSGQFVLCELSEEFVEATLKKMLDEYLKIKKRFDGEIGENPND